MDKRYDGKYQFNTFDQVALGRYLQTWESVLPIFEADATSRDNLGEILKVGLDLVALQYATLPIQFLASVQPLNEEAGVVYFRKAIATMDRAGVTAGQELIGVTGKASSSLSDYMSEEIVNELQAIAAAPQNPFLGPYDYDQASGNDAKLASPVRPRTITINVNGKIRGVDDGEGHLIGVGIDSDTSTINYQTGECHITFSAAHGVVATEKIAIIYSQNIAQATNIPGFRYDVIGKTINVRYFLLQSQYTSLANFVVRRRFGKSLADDVAKDTVAQINGAVLLESIKKLRTSAIKNETNYSFSTLTWDRTPGAGVSDIDHRRTFTDLFEVAANKIEDMSGRSSLSFIVVSQDARQILNSIGFSGERKQVPGPYLAGYFEGMPVFYAPSTILPKDEILFAYRGLMWYESPLVYAPFLPTTLVKTAGVPNAFTETYAAAHGAGIEAVVPEFVVRGRITAS
jgi:hypothetical protein